MRTSQTTAIRSPVEMLIWQKFLQRPWRTEGCRLGAQRRKGGLRDDLASKVEAATQIGSEIRFMTSRDNSETNREAELQDSPEPDIQVDVLPAILASDMAREEKERARKEGVPRLLEVLTAYLDPIVSFRLKLEALTVLDEHGERWIPSSGAAASLNASLEWIRDEYDGMLIRAWRGVHGDRGPFPDSLMEARWVIKGACCQLSARKDGASQTRGYLGQFEEGGCIPSDILEYLSSAVDALVEYRDTLEPLALKDALRGYVPADTLSLDDGISQPRLSEAVGKKLVRWKKAPAGYRSSNGNPVRILYHLKDALRWCSPKYFQGKTGD